MAVLLGTDRLTAIEAVKRSGNEDQRRIIEELSITNEMLIDAMVAEANDRTVNTQLVRTALPHGTHRAYNQGVKSGASQTKTIHDVVCQIATYSKVDKSLADNQPNKDEFIMGECSAFLAGMAEDQMDDMIYGNHDIDPSRMDGLAKRRDKVDNKFCIDFGGTGSNLTSLYLVKWGARNCKLIYPRGAFGVGVQRVYKGVQTVKDEVNGGEYEAYVNYFQADYGLAMGDQRSLIRIANIPANANGEDIVKAILKAKRDLVKGDGTVSILANAGIMGLMDVAALDKSNVVYNASDPWGHEIVKIRDMRLRQCDGILDTESKVS